MSAEMEMVKPAKTAVKLAPEESAHDSVMEESIDKFGDLKAEIEPLEQKLKKLKAQMAPVESSLQTQFDELLLPDQTVAVSSTSYTLDVGMKTNRLSVTDKKALIAELGIDLFLEIADVSVEDMRRYLTDAQLAKCTKTERVGKRTFKVIPKT